MHFRNATLMLITAVLLLPMRASGPGKPRPAGRSYVEAPDLVELRRQGNELFRKADYAGAARLYESGVAEAERRGDDRSAIRFLNNLGSAAFQLLRYRDAARAYLRSRELAGAQADPEMMAATSFNLSSIYLQLGETDAARQAAERGLAAPGAAKAKFHANLLIQLALIDLGAGACDAAIGRLKEAIDVSRDRLDTAGEAQAWNELGNALLECHRLPQAENALLESYRIRKLTNDPRLRFSYESLAELRIAQDNPRAAADLLDRAVDAAAEAGSAALWRPLHARGRARRALGRVEAAYADFEASVRYLQDWRAQVLPSDGFRVRSEVETQRVYSSFVEAAADRYRKTRDLRYAEAGFAAAESGRAASLQALWAGSDRARRLPDEYWRTRAEAQRAETEQIRAGTDDNAVRSARARLTEMEAAAGLETPPAAQTPRDGPESLLRVLRQALGAGEAYIAFYAAETETAVWAVTRDGFEAASAPAGDELAGRIARFVDAVRQNRHDAADLGGALFSDLFGSLSSRILRAERWIVAPDGPLFELPFAALSQGGRYLVERGSLRVTTGVAALLRHPAAWHDSFVGIGDPIYNRADPRFRGDGSGEPARPPLELTRLPGSGREVQSCATVWQSAGRQAAVLTGAAANADNLSRAVAGGPAVVHVAAHMLFPQNGARRGMLALSNRTGTAVELMSETDVAGMDARVGLVVLNGCSSGTGAVLPGTGLMGMTRAWLAAGARSVIATRWPAPDQDAGTMFESLYRLYFDDRSRGARRSFSDLLREAQRAELRAGGRRAEPARWASYFCVETN